MINLNTRPPPIEREREMFYLTTHSTHFINGYMASDIWLRTILIVRKETRCRHIGYSYRVTARDLLYAPSHRQDSTYHSLCYTSRGALAGTTTNWCHTRRVLTHFLIWERDRERKMFYLTTHSTHFIDGYMASDIWLRTILIVRKETRCRHIGYSYRLTARVLLYAPSHRQDNTYRGRYTPVVEHWLERPTNWCQTRVGQMLLILVEFSHIFDLTTVTIQKD